MKKIAIFMLTLMIVFCTFGCGVKPSSSVDTTLDETDLYTKIKFNGEVKSLVAYNIKNDYYFKIRDLANLFKGTDAEFDVVWNGEERVIDLLSNVPYSTNEELTTEIIRNPVATSSTIPIYKDGSPVLLGAYNIEDNSYLKLRDVASAFNVSVGWDAVEGMIEINTAKDYEHPASEQFGLNPQYLSYIGKTKAEIDELLGNGQYLYNLNMTAYDNVRIGWDNGSTPTSESRAVSMSVSFEKLFFNCPEELTADEIKSLFVFYKEKYNESRGENVLSVDYCGRVLEFYPDSGFSKGSRAFIDAKVIYENQYPEMIQIINSPVSIVEDMGEAYYKYAVSHDDDFWKINQDFREDREYYYVVDVDHDGQQEMVVKLGCGVAIFKEINGKVKKVYHNELKESSGDFGNLVARYNGKDYILYTSSAGSEFKALFELQGDKLVKIKEANNIAYEQYKINGELVEKADFDYFVDNIQIIDGRTIEETK